MTNHDSSKVLMGSVGSNEKVVSCENADPASFLAGFAVRRNSSGGLVIADDSTAALIGVSLGPDLSNSKRTAVCRTGRKVPLRVKGAYASGTVEITSYANLVDTGDDEITVGEVTFVAQAGAATLGEDTFQAATSNEATAASLAAQINSNEALQGVVTAVAVGAIVTITAVEMGEDGNLIALAYSDEGTDTIGATISDDTLLNGELGLDSVVIGDPVYVDEVTGDAVDSDDEAAVATSAVVASGILTGVYIDGTTARVILIDMPGGL